MLKNNLKYYNIHIFILSVIINFFNSIGEYLYLYFAYLFILFFFYCIIIYNKHDCKCELAKGYF